MVERRGLEDEWNKDNPDHRSLLLTETRMSSGRHIDRTLLRPVGHVHEPWIVGRVLSTSMVKKSFIPWPW